MDLLARAVSGSSQRRPKGFPQLIGANLSYTLRRTALTAVGGAAFVVAILATTAAIEGHSDAGVVTDSAGRVLSVSPTGFAWRDGVRPGQTIVLVNTSDSPEGWRVITEGPLGRIDSREAPVVEALRGSLPFALIGLAAGCLALAFLRLNRQWVLPAACLALVCCSVPLFLANQPISGPVLALAALVPAAWATWRIHRHTALALVVSAGAVLLVGGWLVAYLNGTNVGGLDEARRTLALGGTGLLMVDRAVQHRSGRPLRLATMKAAWVIAAVILITAGLALIYFAALPAPIVAIAIVLALLAVPPLRRLVGRQLEFALIADLRELVSADVAEEERGRLARELHDAPLQELSAVIRRLELVPEASAETSSLVAIADQLRSVAIGLRPPMLDDLGLGAALDFLSEQLTSAETTVAVSLVDSTGLEPASRPPAPVEFALYRIGREAVSNALRHAQARNVAISGRINKESIDLVVTDDGIGLPEDARPKASGSGRLGLASMRRRAQAIGAEISIDGTKAGTRVAVAWRA